MASSPDGPVAASEVASSPDGPVAASEVAASPDGPVAASEVAASSEDMRLSFSSEDRASFAGELPWFGEAWDSTSLVSKYS